MTNMPNPKPERSRASRARLYAAIERAIGHDDIRVGQLIYNALVIRNLGPDVFYLEDDLLTRYIDEYVRAHPPMRKEEEEP